MTITLKRTVNLSEPVLPEVLSAPLYEGEKNAHTFMITAEKDKLPHALSGAVVAYFERNDGNTVRVEGETKDGAALLTLSPECYQTGVFYLAVMLISDGAQTVIYAASGRVRNTQDGEIIDGGNTIPTYDEIIAHLNKYLSTDITAKVEKTEDGARITMKDVVNGETTVVVKNGKSAYEVAVNEGFEGTPEEWLATLKGDNNIFIVYVTTDEDYNYIADKTADEVRAAVDAGKLPIMFKNMGDIKNTYLYCGEKTLNTERWPFFRTLPIDGAKGHKTILEAYLKNDKMVEGYSEFPVTAVTEHELVIKYGDKETKFDGSETKTVVIKDDVFIVHMDANRKSDKTQAEVRAAAAAGKFIVLVDEAFGWNATYAGEFADAADPLGMRPGFIGQMRNDGTTINYALTYYYLNADGSFTVRTQMPVTTPTPVPLTIKTANGEKTFDGSEPQTIDLTNIGSGDPDSSGGAKPFYFTVREYEGKITPSASFAEIKAAFEAGREPVCIYTWTIVEDDKVYVIDKKILTLENTVLYKSATFHAPMRAYKSFEYTTYFRMDITEKEDGSNTVSILKESYAKRDDIPTKLPNPSALTIVQGNDRWTYSGAEAQTVNLPTLPKSLKNPHALHIDVNGNKTTYDGSTDQTINIAIPEPVTSLPWDKITDKPFNEGTVFSQMIKFEESSVLLFKPININDGVRYTVTAGNPADGSMSFTSTAVAVNHEGFINIILLGNLGIVGIGEDTGEPYCILAIPGGVDEGGVTIYGQLMISDELFAMVQSETLPVKVELADGATPVPEELIPTMSETTKGGAKVGKGLKMDGDVLNVDEGVYELIETIKLPEPTLRIERTKEPDGTDYYFKKIAVEIDIPENSDRGNIVYVTAHAEVYLYSKITTERQNAQRALFKIEINNGSMETSVINFETLYGGTAANPSTISISPNMRIGREVIEELQIYGYNELDAGVIIKIYGVRKDA